MEGKRLPRISAFSRSRYESLVGVSNAIGTHRDPKYLFSALVGSCTGRPV